jgi:type IV pilus assembly protein PilW
MGVRRKPGACRQRGLSLIELMLAVLLGLLLMAGMIQIFVATKVSYTTQAGQAYLHESGRFAMEFVGRDVRMAGLLGCGSRNVSEFSSYLNPLAGDEFKFTLGVRGFEYIGTEPGLTFDLPETLAPVAVAGNWSPTLPASLVGLPIQGSDVLVVRSIGPNPVPLVPPFHQGANVHVQTPNDFAQGDILLVSNCSQAAVFQKTDVSGGTAAGGASGTPGNFWPISDPARLIGRGAFQQGSEIVRIQSAIYYVGMSANGVPALFRAVTTRPTSGGAAVSLQPEELVAGVESMQLLYGVDTTNNFSTDAYVPASGVTDWSRVVAVRMALLLRTQEEFGPQMDELTYVVGGTTINPVTDRRQRRVFTKTMALRNRML